MGKLKKKGESGAATNYITRSQAIKKLQVSLANFRKLCILKGIYPREPKNKKNFGKRSTEPKTYYYKKDSQYLLHEPVLDKIREIRAFNRKLSKAMTKKEWSVAKSLLNQKPAYRLDHIIKERYPTFVDAVRDLDDALSMIFLFATLPANGVIPTTHIETCHRLASEFQHYVMASKSLKKCFISIKGIYYQAEIHGQDVTWVVPHSFSQDTPPDVDFRIMGTFLELHETLVKFVNYRLYRDLNLAYPPTVDDRREREGAGLAAYVIETSDGRQLLDRIATANAAAAATAAAGKSKKQMDKRLKTLSQKISAIAEKDTAQNGGGATGDDDDNDKELDELLDVPEAIEAPMDVSEEVPTLRDASGANSSSSDASAGGLFKSCVFFLSREVPRPHLEFVIRCFGGEVGWEATSGGGSPYDETESRITHQIVDRPVLLGTVQDRREYIQPQWVFDCINAGRILKTKGYHAGETLPPHLSPFGGGKEGYVPAEAAAVAANAGMVEDKSGGVADGDAMAEDGDDEVPVGEKKDEEEDEGPELDDEEDEDEAEVSKAFESDDEEAVYKAELEAEASGMSFSEFLAKKEVENKSVDKKKAKQAPAPAAAGKKRTAADVEAEEEKNLAIMMMSKRDRRLYNQIQFGKKKKEEEAAKLLAKRQAHEKEQAKASKKAKIEPAPAPVAKAQKAKPVASAAATKAATKAPVKKAAEPSPAPKKAAEPARKKTAARAPKEVDAPVPKQAAAPAKKVAQLAKGKKGGK
ncbi:mRNA-binding ribosome synthesis protein nop7 [Blyttiomyces sp. JEL0837]|nr:mRNA-binding ribosome synthesis protein nop7 [Blyttiomyces sp. JEL0837]